MKQGKPLLFAGGGFLTFVQNPQKAAESNLLPAVFAVLAENAG